MDHLIAVVDSDPAFLQALGHILRRHGFPALLLRERTTIWHTIAREQPGLIILDPWWEDPEAGWALLDALWQSSCTAHIPIILCPTDERLLGERAELVAERQYAMLVKPFSLGDLLHTIATVLARRSRQR